MRCVTDLTSVQSTNSLPSTLLKKTSQNKILSPYHDRILPSSSSSLVAVSQQQQQQQQQQQSIPQVEQYALQQKSHNDDIKYTKRNGNNNNNNNHSIALERMKHRTTRPPSPERGINRLPATTTTKNTRINTSFANDRTKQWNGMSKQQQQLQTKSERNKFSFTRNLHYQNSTNNIDRYHYPNSSNNKEFSTTLTSNQSRVVDRTSSVGVLCSRDDEDVYDHRDNYEHTVDDYDDDKEEEEEDDDDDDDHRYIVTITTSRSTIKARGGKDPYRKIYNYNSYTNNNNNIIMSQQQQQHQQPFSNFSELDDESNYNSSGSSKDNNNNNNNYTPEYEEKPNEYTSNPQPERVQQTYNDSQNFVHPIALLQQQHDDETFSSSNVGSKKSVGKLYIEEQSRDTSKSSKEPIQAHYHESNTMATTRSTSGRSGTHTTSSHIQSQTHSRHYEKTSTTNSSLNQFNDEQQVFQIGVETTPSMTKSTHYSVNEDDIVSDINDGEDDHDERKRENDIRSAAASRKSGITGKTGNSGTTGKLSHSSSTSRRSREVLIEEYEKPVMSDNHKSQHLTENNAWKKIENVLFDDDLSELHLFTKPAKDVAFDDLLTTTSDCSSISVSLDPSGKVVYDANNHHTSSSMYNIANHPPLTISNVQFDRVKSALDRMKKPIAIHTTTTTAAATGSGATQHVKTAGLVSYNAPKMKNRIGMNNYAQNNNRIKQPVQNMRTTATPMTSIVNKSNAMNTRSYQLHPEQALVVQGTPILHRTGMNNKGYPTMRSGTTTAIPPSSQYRSIGNQKNGIDGGRNLSFSSTSASSRKDPPAHTLCSEPY